MEVLSSSMEVIKAGSVVLPAPFLRDILPTILAGLLVWVSPKPKSKLRARTRVVIERLIRRLGYEAVMQASTEANVATEDTKLFHHIGKMLSRAQRKRTRKEEL